MKNFIYDYSKIVKVLKKTAFLLLIYLILLPFLKCSGGSKFIVPKPLLNDNRTIPQPEYRKINYMKDGFNKQFTLQIIQSLNFVRQIRHLIGKPKQAFNVDAFDEVQNSSWFINRNACERMSLKEIAKGPDTGNGPDTTDIWIIKSAKSEGVTPGFQIKDKRGDNYMIKFDPKGYSELATGAEVISTKIFYAMGYNVPENYITYFNPKILRMGEGVEFTDEKGNKRPMVDTDIDEIFEKVEQLPDGRIRALASKFIESDAVIGGFKYMSTRKDDPNDIVPHQHRRELRGLYVPCSWLKHFDTKAGNNLDVYVTENGRSFVKHYLIDFGSTLGSAAHSPQPDHKGHENDFDPNVMFQNFITAGLYVRAWEKLDPFQYTSIGRFDSHDFNPGNTKANYPNPAFENCTHRDGYWGAKLVMSFTDEQLEVLVKEGQYSTPEAEAYLLKILKERRDKTGLYWFGKVNPLDKFEIIGKNEEANLHFTDLGIETNLWNRESTIYYYNLRMNGRILSSNVNIQNRTSIPFSKLLSAVKQKTTSDDQFEIEIRTKRENEKLSKWVKVFFTFNETTNSYDLIGLKRQN
jgi:hypothetical protein